MANVWVYKEDGTLQCGLGKEITFEEMKQSLVEIGVNPINMEKRDNCVFYPTLCGAPTGKVNALEITEDDAKLLFEGFIGSLGFQLWTCDGDVSSRLLESFVPWPWSATLVSLTSSTTHPVLVRELISYQLRAYKQGEAITKDFRKDRVNAELDDNGKIVNIWFG